jgi:hypothetical protein
MIATCRLAAILAPDVVDYSQLMGGGGRNPWQSDFRGTAPNLNGFFGVELSRPIAVTRMAATGASFSLPVAPAKAL